MSASTQTDTHGVHRANRWIVIGLGVGVLFIGALGGYALGGGLDGGPGPAAGDDAITVVGTATCSVDFVGEEVIDGISIIEEHFACELDLSDPRVSGTEELIVTSRIDDWTKGGTWTAEAVLTSDAGAWRGSGQGGVSLVGNLPAGAAGESPANFGEMRYVGEGGYDGLTFQYYFSGTNYGAGISGWIETGTGSD